MDLPDILAKKINRYRKWEDRQSVLFGKLLLLKGLQEYGFPTNCLKQLEYNNCLLYTSPSPRDQRGSRMPSSA